MVKTRQQHSLSNGRRSPVHECKCRAGTRGDEMKEKCAVPNCEHDLFRRVPLCASHVHLIDLLVEMPEERQTVEDLTTERRSRSYEEETERCRKQQQEMHDALYRQAEESEKRRKAESDALIHALIHRVANSSQR